MSLQVASLHPRRAIEGGRIDVAGTGFPVGGAVLPEVRIGNVAARVVYASPSRLGIVVPTGVESGQSALRVGGTDTDAYVEIAVPFATGLHQVDNPVFDREGNLFVTYSGTRGQQVPVSIFRVRPNGTREPFSSGIVNPTSVAISPSGELFVSSRFEGTVYRVSPDGSAREFAHDLGVACGLAFAPDGTLYVGDRSGTVFRVEASGRATTFATLPASVAAFHLAMAPDGTLYVSGPTLSSYDPLYRIAADGTVTTAFARFGRPQGIAFDGAGTLFVVDALAGSSGLYRVPAASDPELVLSGPGLVGVAFDDQGTLVVSSNDTAFRLTQ